MKLRVQLPREGVEPLRALGGVEVVAADRYRPGVLIVAGQTVGDEVPVSKRKASLAGLRLVVDGLVTRFAVRQDREQLSGGRASSPHRILPT